MQALWSFIQSQLLLSTACLVLGVGMLYPLARKVRHTAIGRKVLVPGGPERVLVLGSGAFAR